MLTVTNPSSGWAETRSAPAGVAAVDVHSPWPGSGETPISGLCADGAALTTESGDWASYGHEHGCAGPR